MSAFVGAGAGATLTGLSAELQRLRKLGYSAAELNPEYLDCIFGGNVHPGQLQRVMDACRHHREEVQEVAPFALSVHSPAVLDLRDVGDPDLHRRILRSCVEVAGAIGAGILVVHYEQHSAVAAVEEQFRRAVLMAADVAGSAAVTLGVENIEVERAERVVEFVDRLAHPHVRMTYDFGHDFLAAAHFGYEFLASVGACAPYVAHLHLSDNFGRFDPARLGNFTLYKAVPQRNLSVAGLGDVHLPLGWGVLPYDAALAAFKKARRDAYQGILLGEHRRSFAEADGEVLARLSRYAAELAG